MTFAPINEAYSRHGRIVAAIALAIITYSLFYFFLLDLPLIGFPTFRIDYHVTTLTRGDELGDFIYAALHSRPVSSLYVSIQALLGAKLAQGETRHIIYAFQHLALLVFFFSTAKAVESIFKIKLSVIALVSAWLLFITSPAVMEGAYKLETIVGSISMLFGGLSLLFLIRWHETKSTLSASIFLLLYATSIFAKEDFLVPPALLLGWYMLQDGISKERLKNSIVEHKWLLVGVGLLAIFFLVFNKLLIADRAFISPAKQADSPYFMTLDPTSVFKLATRYSFDYGRSINAVFYLYVLTSCTALALRRKWKETLLIALIVGGLMAPYLIMPNHVFPYYSQKWLVWQVLASMALIQIIVTNRHLALAACAAVCVGVVAPTIAGVARNESGSLLSHQGNYLRTWFNISNNIRDSLIEHKDELNKLQRVAIIGIGPGKIDNSPWQNNGEVSFYLSGDLGLTPQWIVYVNSQRHDYTLSPNDTGPVVIRAIRDLAAHAETHAMVFDAKGKGRLVDLRDADIALLIEQAQGVRAHAYWVAQAGLKMTATPSIVPACANGARPQVQVAWDVTAAAPGDRIAIWISKDNKRQLWLAGRAVGEATTGPWVEAGLQFQLESADTHEQLASVTIGGTACH